MSPQTRARVLASEVRPPAHKKEVKPQMAWTENLRSLPEVRFGGSEVSARRPALGRWASGSKRGPFLGLSEHQRKVPCCAAIEIRNRPVDISSGDVLRLRRLSQIGRASVGKECRSRWSPYH